MLNFWKKIQEKGLPTSPKKNNVVVTSLDPRYDGPLRSFDVNSSADVVPLEKGRLTLVFEDLFDNKMACSYLKHFLDSRNESEILHIWNIVTKKMNPDKIFEWTEDETEDDGNPGDSDLSDSQIKFVEEMRSKIFKGENLFFDYCDLSSLWVLLHQILSYLWHEFLRSEWYCRYQIDLLTSRMVTLGDILKHETALSYFTQFLEIEGCHTIVEFWLATSNFQQLVENATKTSDVDESQILDDAINIYEKYLSLLATCPLGFNDAVRSTVEEAICNEMQTPNADSFECAVNVAFDFLRKYYLVPFLSSQHYVHLISDMIRQCTSLMNHSTSTSSVGDCDSTSTSKQLDPHLIWQRRKQSGLSFGKVDQLGRFQSDIEPDPGRNEESRITKMMRKFVQKNVNRMEEEMAWQVAEMVVKDITDLTLGGSVENTVAEHNFCNKECK